MYISQNQTDSMEVPDMISTEEFLEFFEERPAINLKAFGVECDLTEANLRGILTHRFKLTGKVFKKAWPIMLKYGYGYSGDLKKGIKKTATG